MNLVSSRSVVVRSVLACGLVLVTACTTAPATVPSLVAPVPSAQGSAPPLVIAPSTSASVATTPPAEPPLDEPKCTTGDPIKFFVCNPPQANEVGGMPSPYEACPAKRGGKAFSPAETKSRREKTPATCCYLDRCQISYGY